MNTRRYLVNLRVPMGRGPRSMIEYAYDAADALVQAQAKLDLEQRDVRDKTQRTSIASVRPEPQGDRDAEPETAAAPAPPVPAAQPFRVWLANGYVDVCWTAGHRVRLLIFAAGAESGVGADLTIEQWGQLHRALTDTRGL